ncbi:MAG: DUF305 domain-containing protein [Actinomycetes bacterium]
MRVRRGTALAGGLILGAALVTTTACGSSSMVPESLSSAVSNQIEAVTSELIPDDAMFLAMMIPHHEQAVEMSQLAATNGASPEVQKLADTIASAQGPEIGQMQGLLEAAGALGELGKHTGHMDGLLSEEQMSELKAAQGAEFDRLYLEGMIMHHEGAVTMAQNVIDSGGNATVVALAKQIIAAQTDEIAQMKQMLGQ